MAHILLRVIYKDINRLLYKLPVLTYPLCYGLMAARCICSLSVKGFKGYLQGFSVMPQ